MDKVLKVLGGISVVLGIILGIVYGLQKNPTAELLGIDQSDFRFAIAVSWWVSGIISGILFYAFGMMIELLERNGDYLKEILHRTHADYVGPPKKSLGNSKASLDSLKGYTMKPSSSE